MLDTQITAYAYDPDSFSEQKIETINDLLSLKNSGVVWVNIEGLKDQKLIDEICQNYQLHPLIIEDVLNVKQRPKMEELEEYIFVTIRSLCWDAKAKNFSNKQVSIVFGKGFALSISENYHNFDDIIRRLQKNLHVRLKRQGSDYLVYRLLDTIVDRYFVVLEGVGDQIEKIEEKIVSKPNERNSKVLYRLKRQILNLRKAIWPARQILSDLLQVETELISASSHPYLRDIYDHTVQSVDTVELFRDTLSGLIDIYMLSLTNRMNEIMKVLTIIATIFIPITFIASIYGMNFRYMPELNWRWGYPASLLAMAGVALWMLIYFRRKKWI